jgi:hypothetical protein
VPFPSHASLFIFRPTASFCSSALSFLHITLTVHLIQRLCLSSSLRSRYHCVARCGSLRHYPSRTHPRLANRTKTSRSMPSEEPEKGDKGKSRALSATRNHKSRSTAPRNSFRGKNEHGHILLNMFPTSIHTATNANQSHGNGAVAHPAAK